MELAYIALVMAFAAFLQTITSFGFALVAAPLLLFVMNPKDVVMFILITALVNKFILLRRTWDQGSFRAIAIIALASIPGALAGSYALKIANDTFIKALIGVVLLLATAAMASNVSVTFRNKKLAEGIVGMISGFLGSTTSFSGPPVMMYLMNDTDDKDAVRANITRYFILGNLFTLASSYLFGNLHLANLVSSLLVSAPAIGLGFMLGDKLFEKLDAAMFRRMAVGIIGVSGLISVGSGLMPYLPSVVNAISKLH